MRQLVVRRITLNDLPLMRRVLTPTEFLPRPRIFVLRMMRGNRELLVWTHGLIMVWLQQKTCKYHNSPEA